MNILLKSVQSSLDQVALVQLWSETDAIKARHDCLDVLAHHRDCFLTYFDEQSLLIRKIILLKSLSVAPELTPLYLNYFLERSYEKWFIFYAPLLRHQHFIDAFQTLTAEKQNQFMNYYSGYFDRVNPIEALDKLFVDCHHCEQTLHFLLFHPCVWEKIKDLRIQTVPGWTTSMGREIILAFTDGVEPLNAKEQEWKIQYDLMGTPATWPITTLVETSLVW